MAVNLIHFRNQFSIYLQSPYRKMLKLNKNWFKKIRHPPNNHDVSRQIPRFRALESALSHCLN